MTHASPPPKMFHFNENPTLRVFDTFPKLILPPDMIKGADVQTLENYYKKSLICKKCTNLVHFLRKILFSRNTILFFNISMLWKITS